MRNLFVHLSFLMVSTLSLTIHARSVAVEPNPLSFTQEFCSLPAPSNFQCTSNTLTEASFVWDHVPGAGAYTLKTYISSTFILVNTTIVTGDVTKVDIPNLDPSTTYVTRINSVCEYGQQSETYSSASFITFILELVISGYIPGTGPSSCQLNVPQGTPCTFPWNGELAKFKVSKGIQGTNFTVQKNPNGTDGIIMTADILSNPNFQFQGVKLSGPQTCEINVSCSELGRIRVFGGIGQPMELVTELLFAYTNNGFGKIYTPGGIKQGYSIQQIRVNPFERTEPGDIDNPTIRKHENLPESSEKIDIIAVNPFSDQIQITLGSDAKDPISLQLFDFQGRSLHQAEYPSGAEQYTMKTSDIPPGLYMLRVKIGAQITHLKLVKSQ